jgi:hypothetical protein
MPSTKRFALLRDTVRNHPVIVASSAASAGVLLGAFVAVQLLAPPQPRADSAAPSQTALAATGEVKPAPEATPAPETTGSVPASDRTASVDCEQQTWPYLSRSCIEEMQSKYRTRVISTDKLDKSTIAAIESSPPAPRAPAESKPAAPPAADTAPVSPSPSPIDLVAAPSAVFAAPVASPAAVTSAAPPPSQPAANVEVRKENNVEAKKEKRVVTKSKRKPKAEFKFPAKQEFDDDDDTSVASRDSDDRASDERIDRRLERADRRPDRRRIVGRSTEQDYDVPASNGDGQRRVIVIRPSGGGMFESLFGN